MKRNKLFLKVYGKDRFGSLKKLVNYNPNSLTSNSEGLK